MQTLIYSVQEASVGPDPDGKIVVQAKGEVRTTGWTNPILRSRAPADLPGDGILELDFLATKPTGITSPAITPIKASLKLPLDDKLKGVRVYSETNHVEAKLK